jgi:sulfite oxidase
MGVLNRRAWMEQGALGALGLSSLPWIRARASADSPPELIVRSRRPIDLESPISALDSAITPNDAFFVRSHFEAPAEQALTAPMFIGGLVAKPLSLSLKDLADMEQVKVAAVLQCSGNGRAFHKPNVPGVAWERGAVGCAEWEGIRLVDILERSAFSPKAKHLHFLGADRPPAPKTPLYLRSIPIEKALHRDTILATRMNGEPLPILHGGPVRLVVPGWTGNHWMKWVCSIQVSEVEAPGFYMQTGYRMLRRPLPQGVTATPADLVPVTFMNVKSLITHPIEGAVLSSGPLEIRGVAWTGDGHVIKVEVGVNGQWSEAALDGEPRPWAFRRWRLKTTASDQGPLSIMARATDSSGATQPEASPWNKSGYLWNGYDRVSIKIT